jgi:phenylalanine-4-hydroxylase
MNPFTLSTHHAGGITDLVVLEPDHPGFSDLQYRHRRNHIAQSALEHKTRSPIPVINYTDEENQVWALVWKHLKEVHHHFVCLEILQLQDIVSLPSDHIPQLKDISVMLERTAGFRMEPVAGLVSPRTFQRYLGQRIFLSTQYIRHSSKPFYTPEPDIIHEIVGHAASLAHPGIAEVNRLLGLASEVATEREMLRLARVYWYTLEFGLVEQLGEIKAFGAGLLSSVGELQNFSHKPQLQEWDLNVMMDTDYDPTDYQSTLFVAPSFTRLLADTCCWLREGLWREQV